MSKKDLTEQQKEDITKDVQLEIYPDKDFKLLKEEKDVDNVAINIRDRAWSWIEIIINNMEEKNGIL